MHDLAPANILFPEKKAEIFLLSAKCVENSAES